MSEHGDLPSPYPPPLTDASTGIPFPFPVTASSFSSVTSAITYSLLPFSPATLPSLVTRRSSPLTRQSALLVLADGTVLRGKGIGAAGVTVGELVFQTGMVGYQEAMTDPSYAGQMLIFTYPPVGNYGVADSANESERVQARAVILRDSMPSAGHRDSFGELDDLLRQQGVPGMAGVDTRYLTRLVRTHGVIPAALASGPADELPPVEELLALAQGLDYDAHDFVAGCSTPNLIWHPAARPDGPRIAVLDYGVKTSALRRLREMGAGIWQVPVSQSAAAIMKLKPDGVLLTNGPGDPQRLGYAVNTVRELLQVKDLPIFGICLGNQMLALAAGGRTTKMRFGHRGVNQPVLELATGRMAVTTQNHGYMVDANSLPVEFRVSHTNLNDGTVEGIAHVARPVWGVQWHPEAGPGPTDTTDLLERFVALAEAHNA